MTIDQSNLTKGQVRKLNALRKSLGDQIAEEAFSKWLEASAKHEQLVKDPIAEAIENALAPYADDKTFRLGRRGYVVRRAKGKGASGFVAERADLHEILCVDPPPAGLKLIKVLEKPEPQKHWLSGLVED